MKTIKSADNSSMCNQCISLYCPTNGTKAFYRWMMCVGKRLGVDGVAVQQQSEWNSGR